MRGFTLFALLAVHLLVGLPADPALGGPAGGVLINEVFYDPEGPDSGGEFVELINTGSKKISLEGWSLLSGDGAREDYWRTVWSGAPNDTISPGGLFLIGERDVAGADSFEQLSLQNGPDGCALSFDGAFVDLVGWGVHDFLCYYQGAPAQDVSSGVSLSRRPDGADTGFNSQDFAPAAPTPGSLNTRLKGFAFVDGRLGASPLNPEVHEQVIVKILVANTGHGAGRTDKFELGLELVDLVGGALVPLRLTPSAASPGDTVTLETQWVPVSEGAFMLSGRLLYEDGAGGGSDSATVAVRVGPGPVLINEIMYDPVAGGEWVEISNTGDSPVDLAGWSLSDRSGARLNLVRPPLLYPDRFFVAAQDSAAFVHHYGDVDQSAVVGSYAGRWPSLNNSNGNDGYADVLTLADAAGVPSDIAAYSGLTGGGGVSVERLRGDLVGRRRDNWFSNVAGAGATPGRANSARAGGSAGGGLLFVTPGVVSGRGTDGAPVLIDYNLPFRPSRLSLTIYSMDGREVSRLLDVSNGPVRGTVLWNGLAGDGGSLARGAYILMLSGTSEGGRTAKAKAVVAVR